MDFTHKNVLVFGSGMSGIAASRLLLKGGACVILYDSDGNLNGDSLKKEIMGQSHGSLQIILGELPTEIIDTLDLVVMSPGVPTDLPVVKKMCKAGIPLWGEIELAYVCGEGDVLAITGTNGKTTTTALLGEIMKNYRERTFVVGNIGTPYTGIALDTGRDSVIVAEMSSFQLESVHTFKPKISAVLNISPDHLNRHHTMKAYIRAKENIVRKQTVGDICVLNYEDEVTRAIGEKTKSSVLYFSSRRKLKKGVYLEEDNVVLKLGGEPIVLCQTKELKLLGSHNYENVMAAAAMAAAYGVPVEIIRKSVVDFPGVEHRIEFVAEKNGVVYYNDSKGTNPDAAIRGIQAMERPTLLIGGGYDKDSSYDEWIHSFDGKVKKLVLLGQTKEKIRDAARRLDFTDIILTDTFEEAVMTCTKHAKQGDAVLLSPACASWGMFNNYEERGDKFKELVNQL